MERGSCLTGMENLFKNKSKVRRVGCPKRRCHRSKMQPHCIEVEKKKKGCLAATHRGVLYSALYEGDGDYQDSIVVVSKGLKLEVVRSLSLYTVIDLSNNKFEGHIPSVLADLIALRVLNISHNGLKGHIPPSLGRLSVVESLDLSFNRLSGEIPQQLASLTSLEFLNLSHNYLQGCIPQGPQFHTFENSSFDGNDGLHGSPFQKVVAMILCQRQIIQYLR